MQAMFVSLEPPSVCDADVPENDSLRYDSRMHRWHFQPLGSSQQEASEPTHTLHTECHTTAEMEPFPQRSAAGNLKMRFGEVPGDFLQWKKQ